MFQWHAVLPWQGDFEGLKASLWRSLLTRNIRPHRRLWSASFSKKTFSEPLEGTRCKQDPRAIESWSGFQLHIKLAKWWLHYLRNQQLDRIHTSWKRHVISLSLALCSSAPFWSVCSPALQLIMTCGEGSCCSLRHVNTHHCNPQRTFLNLTHCLLETLNVMTLSLSMDAWICMSMHWPKRWKEKCADFQIHQTPAYDVLACHCMLLNVAECC